MGRREDRMDKQVAQALAEERARLATARRRMVLVPQLARPPIAHAIADLVARVERDDEGFWTWPETKALQAVLDERTAS